MPLIKSKSAEAFKKNIKAEIKADIDRIIKYDPRFNVVSQTLVQESSDGNGLIISFSLSFATDNKIADLSVLFDKSSNQLYVL